MPQNQIQNRTTMFDVDRNGVIVAIILGIVIVYCIFSYARKHISADQSNGIPLSKPWKYPHPNDNIQQFH